MQIVKKNPVPCPDVLRRKSMETTLTLKLDRSVIQSAKEVDALDYVAYLEQNYE